MPGPANDNIANATAISGISGSVSSNNNSATTESGETGWPLDAMSGGDAATPYATAWYKWVAPGASSFPTPPPQGGYTYNTIGSHEILFTVFANFKAAVQVYTMGGSVSVTNAVEVSYHMDERVGINCGLDTTARCSFTASANQTYYIRVGGINNAQGNFTLTWGLFNRFTLGPCTGCAPTSLGQQISTLQVTPISAAFSGTLTTPGPGIYQLYYCRGSAILSYAAPSWETIINSITYQGNTWNPTGISAGSPADVWETQQCATDPTLWFVSCGGDNIVVNFSDGSLYGDNTFFQDQPPTIQLVQRGQFPTTSIVADVPSVASHGGVSGSGTSWSFQPYWTNSGFAITALALTATLLNTGGVTGASAPQTGLSAPSGSSSSSAFTFTASPMTTFTTATVVLSLTACGTTVATLTFPLYPIIGATIGLTGGGASCSPSGHQYVANFQVNTIGGCFQVSSYPASVVVTDSLGAICNTSCVIQSNFTASISSGGNNFFHLKGQGVTTSDTLTGALTWGSLTLPSVINTLSVPP